MLTNHKVLALMIIGLFSIPLSNISAQEDPSWISIPIGKSALYVEIAGDTVYVTNPADGKIAIIDANSKELVGNIDTPVGVLRIKTKSTFLI